MAKMVRNAMSSLEGASRRVGDTTADLARRAAVGVTDTARRIGPKRGLLGLVIAGVAIGGTIYLVRYLRSRRARVENVGGTTSESAVADGVKSQRMRKPKQPGV